MTEHKAATISHLNIKNLTMADSGQYSCSTSAKSRATVMLYVINGERRLILIIVKMLDGKLNSHSLSLPSLACSFQAMMTMILQKL